MRFDAGAVDFLVVLDAERQVLTSRDALVQSQVGQATALVSVYRALGGGWNPRPRGDRAALDFSRRARAATFFARPQRSFGCMRLTDGAGSRRD